MLQLCTVYVRVEAEALLTDEYALLCYFVHLYSVTFMLYVLSTNSTVWLSF